MSKKCNKKVIKKENIKGSFTTIHHSILKDKRLTPIAFRILVLILSDSDTKFNVSQKALAKRLGVHLKTIKKALENLEDCGYLKREQLHRGYFYVISEFGNLKMKMDTPKIKEEDIEGMIIESNNLLNQYLLVNSNFMDLQDVHDSIIKLVLEFTDANGLLDFYVFKENADKVITKWKKEIYHALMDITTNSSNNVLKKTIKEYSDWLKEEIFTNNRIPDDEYESKWMAFKLKNKVYKTDYETAAYDKAEEEWADNH